MTPQCPKCNAALKDDYGMVTCPACGTILFIDMDGVAHVGEESTHIGGTQTQAPRQPPTPQPPVAPKPSTQVQPVAPPLVFSPDLTVSESSPDLQAREDEVSGQAQETPAPTPFDYQTFGGQTFAGETPSLTHEETSSGEAPPIKVEYLGENTFSNQAVDLSDETTAEEPVITPDPPSAEDMTNLDMDAFLGYQPAPGEEQPPEDFLLGQPQDQVGSADDPLGLNSYANSEISLGRDGLLLFRILISGIDSKEMRDSLREAIEDPRFGWDSDDLMASISKGALAIENVTPVKATILINRIKRLPVQIRWEQNAITQMDGN